MNIIHKRYSNYIIRLVCVKMKIDLCSTDVKSCMIRQFEFLNDDIFIWYVTYGFHVFELIIYLFIFLLTDKNAEQNSKVQKSAANTWPYDPRDKVLRIKTPYRCYKAETNIISLWCIVIIIINLFLHRFWYCKGQTMPPLIYVWFFFILWFVKYVRCNPSTIHGI
jgi:hypothetical protein